MAQVISLHLKQCVYCHDTIDTKGSGYYHRGTAWFKAQKTRQGTNSAALVQWADHYACKHCIQKKVAGISVNQLELFTLPDTDDW